MLSTSKEDQRVLQRPGGRSFDCARLPLGSFDDQSPLTRASLQKHSVAATEAPPRAGSGGRQEASSLNFVSEHPLNLKPSVVEIRPGLSSVRRIAQTLFILLMPKILHDPQHPTYSTSRYPLPRSPLISMLHLREVMQDLGHSRKPFF